MGLYELYIMSPEFKFRRNLESRGNTELRSYPLQNLTVAGEFGRNGMPVYPLFGGKANRLYGFKDFIDCIGQYVYTFPVIFINKIPGYHNQVDITALPECPLCIRAVKNNLLRAYSLVCKDPLKMTDYINNCFFIHSTSTFPLARISLTTASV